MNDDAKARVTTLRAKFEEYRETAHAAIETLTKERDAAAKDAAKWRALYQALTSARPHDSARRALSLKAIKF